jgi:hypothetical protein
MYRDDYILRMIQRFGQVIAHIAGLRRQGQYPMALFACDDAMRNALGIGSADVAGRSEREILALIRFADRDGSWRELAAYVAAVLHAEACIYEAQGDDELVPPRALLALQLLVEAELARGAAAPESSGTFSPLLAEASDGPLPDFAPPREHLLELLHGFSLPSRTRAGLLALYEAEGAYARAEDTLFELLADEPANNELRQSGVAFYERILAHDDAALTAGGLPRPEAEASLAELRRPALP